MSATAFSAAPAFEPTAIGDQMLVPGVIPITARDRLAMLAAAPLIPGKPQRPLDIGLFDVAARNQLDLFARRTAPSPELPPRGG